MNHTCLCLPSRSWYSFTDPGGMEGWVGLGLCAVRLLFWMLPYLNILCTSSVHWHIIYLSTHATHAVGGFYASKETSALWLLTPTAIFTTFTIKLNSKYRIFPAQSALSFQRLSAQSFVHISLISLSYPEWNVELYSLSSVRHNILEQCFWQL